MDRKTRKTRQAVWALTVAGTLASGGAQATWDGTLPGDEAMQRAALAAEAGARKATLAGLHAVRNGATPAEAASMLVEGYGAVIAEAAVEASRELPEPVVNPTGWGARGATELWESWREQVQTLWRRLRW